MKSLFFLDLEAFKLRYMKYLVKKNKAECKKLRKQLKEIKANTDNLTSVITAYEGGKYEPII